MTTDDINELLDWSPVEQRGPHRFRQAVAPPEFVRFYASHEALFRDSGVRLFQHSAGAVSFAWFIEGPYAATSPLLLPDCACPGECLRKPAELQRLGLPRDICGSLRCYQLPGVVTLTASLRQHRVAVNTSRLGSGKTYTACAVARLLGHRLLVVAPLATLPTWRRVAEFMGCGADVINYEKLRTGKQWGQWVKVKRHEEWRWTLPDNTLLVYDEAHNASGLKSQNAEIMVAAVDQKIPLLPMSGTLASEPLKLRAIGYALGIHRLTNFEEWLRSCGYTDGNYGPEWRCGMTVGELFTKVDGEWKMKPSSGAELNRRQSGVMLRIRSQLMDQGKLVSLRTEDIPNFPECDHLTEAVDFGDDGGIDAAYALMRAELEELARLRSVAERRDSKLAIQLRAQQTVELLKVPVLASMAAEAVEDGSSVVLFVLFRESAVQLMKLLKTKCCVMGAMDEADRERNIADYMADRERVIVVTEQCGGAGLNLQDLNGVFPRLALLAPTFNAVIFRQAGGRIHRDGSKSKATVKALFAAGTVEEKAKAACDRKLRCVDMLNDGDLDMGIFPALATPGVKP